jgi:hypothetical protein
VVERAPDVLTMEVVVTEASSEVNVEAIVTEDSDEMVVTLEISVTIVVAGKMVEVVKGTTTSLEVPISLDA